MNDTTIGVRIDNTTKERLKMLAEKRDRTPHYLMKEALSHFLTAEENKEAELDLMKERWARFEVTGQVVSRDDMREWSKSLRQS